MDSPIKGHNSMTTTSLQQDYCSILYMWSSTVQYRTVTHTFSGTCARRISVSIGFFNTRMTCFERCGWSKNSKMTTYWYRFLLCRDNFWSLNEWLACVATVSWTWSWKYITGEHRASFLGSQNPWSIKASGSPPANHQKNASQSPDPGRSNLDKVCKKLTTVDQSNVAPLAIYCTSRDLLRTGIYFLSTSL
jgi:hypothetical protein